MCGVGGLLQGPGPRSEAPSSPSTAAPSRGGGHVLMSELPLYMQSSHLANFWLLMTEIGQRGSSAICHHIPFVLVEPFLIFESVLVSTCRVLEVPSKSGESQWQCSLPLHHLLSASFPSDHSFQRRHFHGRWPESGGERWKSRRWKQTICPSRRAGGAMSGCIFLHPTVSGDG